MTKFDQTFWQSRYLSQQTGWDIGAPSTPLAEFIQSLKDKNLRVLIPGCGNAYETEVLLASGFKNITLLDIAPAAVETLQKKFAGSPIRVVLGDFFEHTGQYDLILEQTFFCALDPSLRTQYVQNMKSLLAPGGHLVGVLFSVLFDGGPPFGGSESEYRELFKGQLEIEILEPCRNSIGPRRGNELFLKATPPKTV